jgi:hypothetical protein
MGAGLVPADFEETPLHSVLLGLAQLACPVGMGLMMWMLIRGQRVRDTSAAGSPVASGGDHASDVDALRAEIELLKADHVQRDPI